MLQLAYVGLRPVPNVDGVVSFYGVMSVADNQALAKIRTKLLVLQPARVPSSPADTAARFQQEFGSRGHGLPNPSPRGEGI